MATNVPQMRQCNASIDGEEYYTDNLKDIGNLFGGAISTVMAVIWGVLALIIGFVTYNAYNNLPYRYAISSIIVYIIFTLILFKFVQNIYDIFRDRHEIKMNIQQGRPCFSKKQNKVITN